MFISVYSASFLHILRMSPDSAGALAGLCKSSVQKRTRWQLMMLYPRCLPDEEITEVRRIAQEKIPVNWKVFCCFLELDKAIKTGNRISKVIGSHFQDKRDRNLAKKVYFHLSSITEAGISVFQTLHIIIKNQPAPRISQRPSG